VECEEYYRDFANLATVTVLNRGERNGNLPRPARHRGNAELDYTFQEEPAG